MLGRILTRKIAMSVLVIAVATAMVTLGTFAYFSDSETSTGNTFGAGTLDLIVNGENPLSSAFAESNLYPGWSSTEPITVTNGGTIDGNTLTVSVQNLANDDNSCNEPEALVDTTCGVDPDGDLGANMDIVIHDVDANVDIWSGTLNQLAGAGSVPLGSLNASQTRNFELQGSIGTGVGNIIQSDAVTFDIVVDLTQN